MAYTLSELRAELKLTVGDVWEGTTTSPGGAGGSSLISTYLSARALSDDAYKYQWVLITSGSCVGEERLISSFTRSTSTITPAQNFSSQISSGVTFEISRIRPSLLTRFINQALRDCYPQLHVPYDHRGMVAGGLVYNDDFEDWATTSSPEWWTVNAGTVTRDSAGFMQGGYCARILGGALNPAVYFSPMEYSLYHDARFVNLAGKTITWYKYAKTSTANSVRLGIICVNGSGVTTSTYGDYHTGGGAYERLSVTAAIPSTLASISFAVDVKSGDTAYVDSGYCESPFTLYEYPLPSYMDFVGQVFTGTSWDNPNYGAQTRLFNAHVINRGDRKWLRIDSGLSGGQRLRIVGYGPFADLSSNGDSINVSAKQAEAVVEKAAARYFAYLAGLGAMSAKDRADLLAMARAHAADANSILERNQMAIPFQINLADDSGDY